MTERQSDKHSFDADPELQTVHPAVRQVYENWSAYLRTVDRTDFLRQLDQIAKVVVKGCAEAMAASRPECGTNNAGPETAGGSIAKPSGQEDFATSPAPTPRTDALIGKDNSIFGGDLSGLCRQLERELAEAKNKLHLWAVEMNIAGVTDGADNPRYAIQKLVGVRSARPDITPMVQDLIFAARRVWKKYGHDENGVPSDWTEWTDVRDALNAIDSTTVSTRQERE